MQNEIEQLKPQKVFYYFKEICNIPHGSSNTLKISNYCVDYAIKHNFKYIQDDKNNIIIFKEASKGREHDDAVIIQGHLDMVNEKVPGSKHDFEKDALQLEIDGDYIYAKDTTLGADDGIAIAYALAILDDDSISHPRIEAVFTVDEEIGMLGAQYIDLSKLTGKYLLNIDSEEEGKLLVGCAGGLTSICKIPICYEQNDIKSKEKQKGFMISINGLKGGHSGTEIIKERANANILMGRLLEKIKEKTKSFKLCDINGGTKDNAIVRLSEVKCMIEKNEYETFLEVVNQVKEEFQNEYQTTDENINIEVIESVICDRYIENESFEKIVYFLMQTPYGIIHMNKSIEGLVETSLNLGILKIEKNHLIATYSVRSSVKSRKEMMSKKLQLLTEFLGGKYETSGNYPEWSYKKDSKLRDIMSAVYEEMFHEKPIFETIHAGVECGYFNQKITHLDAVSFGPNIYDIHTTEEKMSISSVEKTYDYIIEILKRLK